MSICLAQTKTIKLADDSKRKELFGESITEANSTNLRSHKGSIDEVRRQNLN